jgi:gp16 family phage-associated protein
MPSSLNGPSRPYRSPEEVKADLRRQGVTLAAWARENNFSQFAVYQVLAGRRKCLRGVSYDIARRLGMK